ncbi:hypothetical protein Smp_171300 [Schistosoma mansoni]|uniref:hypothetical protein n=1 Tax=Schistosoma mansoni TaxID=6183 RepID=UPI00022C83AA|nr:hypothetical protein Smp_171300 [Schistosoma mansoni]|eukprot:XP_018646426.1 hypothetical protein Smp_171300 [Schistosoma mansoni]
MSLHMSYHRVLLVLLVCVLTSSCAAQSLTHTDNYTYFNVSGCLAFFARSISVKLVSGKTASIVPIPASSLSLSPLSKCSDLKSLLVFTSSNVNEISDLNVSLTFSKSGRYWSVSESSVSIKCQSGSKSCVNVPGNPLAIKWAEAPVSLGYKCTKPSVAPVIFPSGSGYSVQPFGVKDGVFGDVTDCVGNNMKLQYLWLNSVKSNGIIFESNHLISLPYLYLLDLSYTELTSLHESNELALNGMKHLKELYLGGNPWICDCKLNWLKLWFIKKSFNHIKFQKNKTNSNGHIELIEPLCYKPDHLKGKRILSSSLSSSSSNDQHNMDHLLWYKDDQLVQNTTNHMIIYGQLGSNYYSNLIVTMTTGKDTGLWSCVLNNQYRTLFEVNIINSDGKILYPNDDDQSFINGAFILFGMNGQTKNWIYAGIALVTLFVILALIGIGIFCCCDPHTRSSDTSTDLQVLHGENMKSCSTMNKSGSICRRRFKCIYNNPHHHKKTKVNKDDSGSSLLVTTHDEQKMIDKNDLQLISTMKDDTNTMVTSATMMTTNTIPNSDVHMNNIENDVTSLRRNIDENRLLNIFCCPTNATREVQFVTIPITSSASSSLSTNVTHLGGSLIQGTVVTGENRVLVSCDSPEPKLLIATNGITPSTNICSLDFSTCLQQQQQQSLNVIPQQSCTGWDGNGSYSVPQFPGIYTSSQITIETSKPCPVHGIMNLKQMEMNCDMPVNTTIDSNHANTKQLPNYKKVDSIYWDHSNSSTILTDPHLSYNLSNCIFLDSQNHDHITNGTHRSNDHQKNEIEVIQNYSKPLSSYHDMKDYSLLQKANLNEVNLQWSTDSRSQGTCPVHGNQTLSRRNDPLKHIDKEDIVLGSRKHLKRNHLNKSIIHEPSSYHIDHCHHEMIDHQEVSICSSNDTNNHEETDNQSNSVHYDHYSLPMNSIKPKQIIYTSNDETESHGESSLSEKSLHSDDCTSHSCTSSISSSTNSSSSSSINQHFKYIYPSNQTGFNSICSSLSNQINLAAAAAAAASVNTISDPLQQQSPPSLEFCPSSELLSNRPNSNYDTFNNLKCPVHSLTRNHRFIPRKLFYDTYNHRENMRQHHHHDKNNNRSSLRTRVKDHPSDEEKQEEQRKFDQHLTV